MNKTSILSKILFVSLITILFPEMVNATSVNVTDANLKEAIEGIKNWTPAEDSNVTINDSADFDISVNTITKVISVLYNGQTSNIGYTINADAVDFTNQYVIDDSSTYASYAQDEYIFKDLVYGYLGIATLGNGNYDDASNYFFDIFLNYVLNNLNSDTTNVIYYGAEPSNCDGGRVCIPMSEFNDDPVGSMKKLYPTTTEIINDDGSANSFSIAISGVSSTESGEEIFTVTNTLSVKRDADYTKLASFLDDTTDDTTNDTTGNNTSETPTETTDTPTDTSTTETTENPPTGEFLNYFMIIIGITISIGIIIFINRKQKFYKI